MGQVTVSEPRVSWAWIVDQAHRQEEMMGAPGGQGRVWVPPPQGVPPLPLGPFSWKTQLTVWQVEPLPPHTPQRSSTAPESIRKSQPTFCKTRRGGPGAGVWGLGGDLRGTPLPPQGLASSSDVNR